MNDIETLQARNNELVAEIETLKKAVLLAKATGEQDLLNDMARRLTKEGLCPFCGQFDAP